MVLSKFINIADPFINDNDYDYPVWLGNLWNCLDWCDENWTHDSAPQVEDEIDRIFKAIKKEEGRDNC